MPYKYTARDLLDGPPFHYMFSAYEGAPFLEAYIRTREADLARLGVTQALADPKIAPDVSDALPALGGTGFETEPILASLVAIASRGPVPLDWIDMFLRKFEAAKRLRRAYDGHLKIADPALVERIAYARLAYLAAIALAGPGDFRRLNALLKLNDIVLSAPSLDAEARMLAARSVACEVSCIRALAGDRGVALGEAAAC